MTKVILFVCLLMTVIAACHGYSFLIPSKVNRPGVCFYNGVYMRPGDHNIPYSCQNMRCNDDGSILVQGCGHYDRQDCQVIDMMNLHKPYPDCCRMNFHCTQSNGETVYRQYSPLDLHSVYE